MLFQFPGFLSQLSFPQREFLIAMKTLGKERNIPNISWNTAEFFIKKFQNRSIKNVLEIGPANGFSTMILSLACPEAHIFSVECSRHAFEELRQNITSFSSLHSDSEFVPANLPPKITSDISHETIGNFSLYYADARELLPAFITGQEEVKCISPQSLLRNIPKQTFDLIFIDGAFRMTQEFLTLSLPLLNNGGTVIIDDVVKYAWKMDGFYEFLESEEISHEIIHTDEDDGVMLIENGEIN